MQLKANLEIHCRTALSWRSFKPSAFLRPWFLASALRSPCSEGATTSTSNEELFIMELKWKFAKVFLPSMQLHSAMKYPGPTLAIHDVAYWQSITATHLASFKKDNQDAAPSELGFHHNCSLILEQAFCCQHFFRTFGSYDEFILFSAHLLPYKMKNGNWAFSTCYSHWLLAFVIFFMVNGHWEGSCLLSIAQVLLLNVDAPRDSYAWHYKELATLPTLSKSLAKDRSTRLVIKSMCKNITTELSWHLTTFDTILATNKNVVPEIKTNCKKWCIQ